jgi:hypothetical protein
MDANSLLNWVSSHACTASYDKAVALLSAASLESHHSSHDYPTFLSVLCVDVYTSMPARYAPIPHAVIDHDAELEMNAAFADSGDDDSDSDDDLETKPLHPLARGRARSHSPSPVRGGPAASSSSAAAAGTSALPGAYDFEAVDYDLPPPGSPPPATQAFANNWGNSNGVVPDGVDTYRAPRRGWLGRTAAAILPAHYVSRIPGVGSSRPSGPVGGGNQNDGVFANVTAKPVRGVQVRDGRITR